MSNAQTRLIQFLTDSSFTDREFREFIRLVDSRRIVRCIEAARHLRDVKRHILADFGEDEVDDEVHRRIRELLIEDLEIPTGKALEALALELGEPSRPSTKAGFREGLKRLLSNRDGSEVLSAAQRIANRLRNPSAGHEWSLGSSLDK